MGRTTSAGPLITSRSSAVRSNAVVEVYHLKIFNVLLMRLKLKHTNYLFCNSKEGAYIWHKIPQVKLTANKLKQEP